MADLTPSERLQPCLLDRLTDDEPNQQQESRMKRVMSLQRYRQAVLRDLAWLLNTYANAEQDRLDEFEEIPSSVLNYGVQNGAGITASSVSADEMRYRLTEAIQRFEPRIIANTIAITLDIDPEAMTRRSIRFEIRGDLWSEPLPESLFIATELDLETGKSKLTGG